MHPSNSPASQGEVFFRGDNFELGAAAPGALEPGRADARRVAVINRLSGSWADAAKNSAL